jgi:murein DD-endopeptidase MepM/ murein hydrolase activator NlpD
VRRIAVLPALALLLTAATRAVPPEQETEHIVEQGETLMSIANRVHVPRGLIAEANGLIPPYTIRAGQKLKVPRTGRHTVRSGDTGFSVAYATGVPWRDVAVANGIDPDAPLHAGQVLLIPTLIATPQTSPASPATQTPAPAARPSPARSRFAWPLAGSVRRSFRARSAGSDYHDGLDITAREGTPVRAAAAGKVLFADMEPRQYGNLVVVDHGHGWVSAYAFLSRMTVQKDQEVRAGERVGFVGHTGQAKGPELHFELRQDNQPVDPAVQLPAAASPAPRTPPPLSDRPQASNRSRSAGSEAPAHGAPGKARSRE